MYLRFHVSAKSMCVRICANASHFHVNEFHENIFISCNFHIRARFAFEFMLISSLPHSPFPSPVLISLYSLLPLTCLKLLSFHFRFQIPPLPPHCPQTPRRAPLLHLPYPGPWRWSVEMVGERLGNIAVCVEPGSTTL